MRRLFLFLMLLALSCAPPAPPPTPPADIPAPKFNNVSGKLRAHVLDVGQGDAILIITPEKKAVLVDAGTSRSSETVLQALQKYNIEKLDLAVATHPHADHIGGMSKVLDTVPVKNFLDSGQPHPTATYEKMLATIKAKIGKLIVARAGQKFELDSGIQLLVLGPSSPMLEKVSGSDENANSVILKLVYGNFQMLLTGDSEDETEERLLERGVDLKAKVLKVAHHGSNYASTTEFLEKVTPEAAIISCGTDNDYGHPAPKTLKRLKQIGAKLYRTDLNGEITVVSDGKEYEIQTERNASELKLWQGRTKD